MNVLVKNQHYVWRTYLRPWSIREDGKQINTYFIDKKEMGVTSLMNVAQERFFYEIHPLSDIEIVAAKRFAKQFPEFVQPYADVLLSAYVAVSKNMIPDQEKNIYAKNCFEKIYTQIEEYGYKLLECKSREDLMKIANDDQCMLYLCVQYGRTKKMRMNGVNGLRERPLAGQLYDKLFPMTTILYAVTLAHNLSINPTTKYIFVKNETKIPFITSDQPAINLFNDDVDEEGNVLSFELYYPTSPSTAIMVSFAPRIEKYSEIFADEGLVETLNRKICVNARSYIFSNGTGSAYLQGLVADDK